VPDRTLCGDRRSCGPGSPGAAAQVLLGIDTEHRWIRFAYCRLGHLFRYLLRQPGYHKRLTAAAPLLAAAITHLARVSPS
jgi:hypothetical protein